MQCTVSRTLLSYERNTLKYEQRLRVVSKHSGSGMQGRQAIIIPLISSLIVVPSRIIFTVPWTMNKVCVR